MASASACASWRVALTYEYSGRYVTRASSSREAGCSLAAPRKPRSPHVDANKRLAALPTTHAHDRCARARTDPYTTTASIVGIIIIVAPTPSLLSFDRSYPTQPLAITAATSLHYDYGCSSRSLCSAVMFSFRVYVPVYALLMNVVRVLARTDYYY